MPLSETTLSELQKKKKTRFPLSRIKKIIQQNEDVGKAAITVPVVLSKAIELFFEQIICKLVQSSEKRQSKKIQVQDLKSVVEEYEHLYGFMKQELNPDNVEE
ncbi:hypothetical protein GINT2_002073 [Glugoides intestinalis]